MMKQLIRLGLMLVAVLAWYRVHPVHLEPH